MEYTVYWYKRPIQTNPYTEGYIGITNNMKRRDLEHRRNKTISHFTNALKLYNDISYQILHTNITKEEALELEYSYRPDTNIGWNSAIGGEDTLKSFIVPIMLYHESDYTKLYKFSSITEAANTLQLSESRLRQAKYRNSTHYGYDGWAICYDETANRSITKTISELAKEKNLGLKRNKPSHFKGKTNRWSDEEKARISKQHKGKIISEKQKEIVSIKNRTNHSKCKTITLAHISNPEIPYTYHSISEASRQLNIPLSRLKSKAQRPLNKYGKDGWAIINLGSE